MNTPAENTALERGQSSIAHLSPSRSVVVALAAWSTVGLAGSVWAAAMGAWWVTAVVLAAALLLDALSVRRTPALAVCRTIPGALAIHEWHDVTIRIENPSRRSLTVEVIDAPSVNFRSEGIPRTLTVAAGKWQAFTWRIRPTVRGVFTLPWIEIRLTGVLGLMRQRRRIRVEDQVRVYPNFRAGSRFGLLALDNRVSELGIHTRRRRGQGLEFMQLREYREGDPLRQIDWKAVSRRNQLISREYREEQNQQVIFLLDCGRRMRTRDRDLAYFDHVLNAVLLTSYIALRQGDAVGAYTFSGEDRVLPPRKGHGAMNMMLNGLFDIQPNTAPSDYVEAAARIATRVKRRALVILITNLRDEDARELPIALAPLRRKHLVLLASLREPIIEAACNTPVHTLPEALRVTAAHQFMDARQRAHALVRGSGVQTLDVLPASLPVALVHRYLDIKRSGAL